MTTSSANILHQRSISLPSTSHPSFTQVEECLSVVRSWVQASASNQRQSVKAGFHHLRELHLSTISLLQPLLTQRSMCDKETITIELMEVFVGLLDVCGVLKDSFSQLREQYQHISSLIRRKDSSLRESIGIYQNFRMKMRKDMIKCLRLLKSLRINRHAEDYSEVFGILIDVNATTISMLEIFIQLAFGQKASESAFSKLRLLGHKRSDKKADGRAASEIERLDEALYAVYNKSSKEAREESIQTAHELMVSLDSFLSETESEIESLFRRLINFRASLLNILTIF